MKADPLLIQMYRSFCSILDIISHSREVFKNNFFPSVCQNLTSRFEVMLFRFVLIAFHDESICVPNVSCGSKISELYLMGPFFCLLDYKQTDLVYVLRLVVHPNCISQNAVWQRPTFSEILGFHLELHHKKHVNRFNSIFMFDNFIELF